MCHFVDAVILSTLSFCQRRHFVNAVILLTLSFCHFKFDFFLPFSRCSTIQGATTLGIMTFSIVTLSIMTVSVMDLFKTLSVNDT
jgi:hypothetical protein